SWCRSRRLSAVAASTALEPAALRRRGVLAAGLRNSGRRVLPRKGRVGVELSAPNELARRKRRPPRWRLRPCPRASLGFAAAHHRCRTGLVSVERLGSPVSCRDAPWSRGRDALSTT